MKKSLAVVTLLVLILSTAAADAVDFRKTVRLAWPSGQTVSNELWAMADTVQIDGVASRALFLQSREARLAGEFQRDVWALCESITFSGTAAQSLRLVAKQEVQVEGRVGAGLMVAADTVRLSAAARVGEDAILFAQNISTEGMIEQKLVAIGNRVTIGGHIGGNCRIGAEEIILMPGTEIQGDLIYTSPKELIPGSEVKLRGKLIRQPTLTLPFRLPKVTPGQVMLLQLAFYLAALLTSLPFMAVFPRSTTRAVLLLQSQPGKCLLAGAIGFALLLMLGALALVTWVGIPLGLLLLFSFFVLLYLAKVPVALVVGGRLLRNAPSARPRAALPLLALGLLLLYLAASLPMVGWMVWLLVTFYGMGALILAVLSGEREPLLMTSLPAQEQQPTPPPLDGFSP